MHFNSAITDTNAHIRTPKSFDCRALLGCPRLDQGRVHVGAGAHRCAEAAETVVHVNDSVWDIRLQRHCLQ